MTQDNQNLSSEFDIDISEELELANKASSWWKPIKKSATSGKKDLDDEYLVYLRNINIKFKNLILIPFILIIIFGTFIYVGTILSRYYELNWSDRMLTESEAQFVNNTQQNINSFLTYFKLNTNESDKLVVNYVDSNFANVESKVDEYIKSDVSYVIKKQEVKKFYTELHWFIKSERLKLKQTRENVIKFSFLPEEINTIASDNEIQRALLSIESIKFYTAMKVFSFLSSFVQGLSAYLSESQDSMMKRMKYYIDRWEWDTERFLKYCYLNVAESENCDKFWDFSTYYQSKSDLNGKWSLSQEFKPELFIKMMTYIDQKLESDTFPRLAIVLNNLEPKSNEIWFSVDINTFKEDEQDLLSYKGSGYNSDVKIPHVFIITELINSLRKSHFIIWTSINLDTLKVTKRKVKEWDVEYFVNSSKYDFKIPVQKSTEREIYDYIDKN